MSKINLKDHKGTVVVTSVIAGAALAPILTGQLHHEGQKEYISVQQPLTSFAPVDSTNQILEFPDVSPLYDGNTLSTIKNEHSLIAYALPERQPNNQSRLRSAKEGPPLQLITLDRFEEDSAPITSASYNIEMNSAWPEDTLLTLGDEGPKVKTIQQLLKDIGYYIHSVDGVYNEKTRNAIKLYQKDHGLMIDGIVGLETVTHLVGTKTVVTDVSIPVDDGGTNVYTPPNVEGTVYINTSIRGASQPKDDIGDRSYFKFGDVHEEIIELQELLSEAGYYSGVYDGIYGSTTQQAVRLLQREQGLMVDGLAGNQVFTFLRNNDLKKIAENRQRTGQQTTVSATSTVTTSSSSQEQRTTTASSSMESIIARAHELLGTPYAWGGTTPAGFDCSGFLVYVYQHVGKDLPRTVSDIWGVSSSVSAPQRGDFVFFETYKPGLLTQVFT
ncbi:MAG: peptidoglycan-binding protein [Bacillus sp. (in: Bacteria)]|nr:peptidoglycan-binding protein [Bacillus sp. (in: firmicutes)]